MEEKKEFLRCRAILEILGKPKDHVEKTRDLLLGRLRDDPSLSILHEYGAPLSPKEKTLFATYVELEMVFKDLSSLIGFCFDYMPSSLDIEKPMAISFENHELSAILNDLQAKLHNVDMIAKTLRAERDVLKKNMHTMTLNTITILSKIGKSTLDELSKFSGVDKAQLEKFLEDRIKEGVIEKSGDRFQIAPKSDD